MGKKCYICDNNNINLFKKIQSENNELYQLLTLKGEIFNHHNKFNHQINIDIYWLPIYSRYVGNSEWVKINDRYGKGEKHFDICKFCIYDKNKAMYDDYIKVKRFDEGLFRKKKVAIIDVEHIKKNKKKWKNYIETEWQEAIKLNSYNIDKRKKHQKKDREKLENDIVTLLKNKGIKISVSDINALLKFGDLDMVKVTCEGMYENGKIDFGGNGRYFILSEDNSKPKTKATSSKKSDTPDVKIELKKFKEMLDEELITQEQYDAKSNELLGL